MQYNNYSPAAHQVHSPHHPSQSNDDYASPYPEPSHNHSTLSYAAVTPDSHFPPGSMASVSTAHQSVPPQYSYSHYGAQSSPEDHRSYYATPSQAPAVDQYASPSSPAGSYTAANASNHLSPQASLQHSHHLSPQQQQQFIPTPSQAYQVYSSSRSGSSARSRSTVEPYYRMSPNPQHVAHAPPSTTHVPGGTSGRSSNASRGPPPHTHAHHTGTIVVATGERYPCDLCDRSFTRLHDRRRHYETVHATSPVSHTCRFCQKGFSRSDSLKRHVDNGCDDMPR